MKKFEFLQSCLVRLTSNSHLCSTSRYHSVWNCERCQVCRISLSTTFLLLPFIFYIFICLVYLMSVYPTGSYIYIFLVPLGYGQKCIGCLCLKVNVTVLALICQGSHCNTCVGNFILYTCCGELRYCETTETFCSFYLKTLRCFIEHSISSSTYFS